MMKRLLIIILSVVIIFPLKAQSRKELENKRKKNLEEIEYVDNLLKNTSKKKNESLNEIKVIGKKLNLRQRLIDEYGTEISLLEYRISLNRTACEMMEDDLKVLGEEYKKSIVDAYKISKGTPPIAYILSAKDFNQGYKRLKYIQQIAKYRRNEAELIMDLYSELETTRNKLATDLSSVSDLKKNEEMQKLMLNNEQDDKKRLVQNLTKKEKELKSELEEKKKIARHIESEINRIIDEERKKTVTVKVTKEKKISSDSFEGNKGRLPWPVSQGVITSHFGLQPHPVLKNVTEDNIGIEITTSADARVKTVYKGQVARVFSISGASMAVIIRHGKYLTVYQNLINLKVKQGDNVETGKEIGEVYLDPAEGKAVLRFMIYAEKSKLDPEDWLVKKGE